MKYKVIPYWEDWAQSVIPPEPRVRYKLMKRTIFGWWVTIEKHDKRDVLQEHANKLNDVIIPVINDWNHLQVLESPEFNSIIRINYLKANYPNGVIIRQK